jgi:hypothetical protein
MELGSAQVELEPALKAETVSMWEVPKAALWASYDDRPEQRIDKKSGTKFCRISSTKHITILHQRHQEERERISVEVFGWAVLAEAFSQACWVLACTDRPVPTNSALLLFSLADRA